MPPPAGYLDVAGIDACVSHLLATYPGLCQAVPLPEATANGRPIRAFRLRAGSSRRNGVLLIGGTHANETINPDLLVRFALHLCAAYSAGTGLTYGGRVWSATDIRVVLDATDLFFIPQLNPDGRAHVFDPNGYRWWRKNRSVNTGSTDLGTDLNRNYGFLWDWSIGNTSTQPSSAVYRGDVAFSEPETRNVRWLLGSFPDIVALVDVHSYKELLLHPWGDDNNQTTDPAQNFQNPAYDGQRGVRGVGYAEYIPPSDLARYVDIGSRVRTAIADVRGRTYTVQQAVQVYPTSGTSKDYAYGRYFHRLRARTKVWAWTFETNRGDQGDAYGFQPPYSHAWEVMDEVSSGLIQLALSTVCLVREVGGGVLPPVEIEDLRVFRETAMRDTRNGDRWISALEAFGEEVLAMTKRDREFRRLVERAIVAGAGVALAGKAGKPVALDDKAAEPMRRVLSEVVARGSPQLARVAKRLSGDLDRSIGKTAVAALGRKRRAPAELPVVRPDLQDVRQDQVD